MLAHVGTQRTYLPSGTLRRVNRGSVPTASATKQISEPICRLEALSDIDEALIDIAPNKQEARAQEDRAFIEGLGINFGDYMIYGSLATDPEGINGFATKYASSTATANVILANGSGDDTTSLWIVEWGPTKVHCTYPRNSQGGLRYVDHGKQRVADAETTTGYYYAYESQFVWEFGVFVHDDRCIQRIANIETSGDDNTLDDNDIIEALNKMPTAGGSGARIYVNRTLKTQLEIMAKDKNNVNYAPAQAFGAPVVMFRGVPVRLEETILNTETAIS